MMFDLVPLTLRSCTVCAQAECIPIASSSSSGVGKGALAGAVVGVLAFLFLVIGGFLWWRRRSAHRRAVAASREKAIENIPGVGPSSTLPPHLTAMGAVNNHNATSPTNPRFSRPLMPASEKTPGIENENPFETASVRSGAPSAESIPIAMASEGQLSPTGTAFTGGVPQRPARSPDLNIRNTPLGGGVLSSAGAANANGLAPPRRNYAPSQRTDFTTSTMDSTASSAMEALYESPTIVTGVKRTVIGAGRSEVVPVTSVGSSPSTPRGMLTPTSASGPSSRRNTHGTPGPSPLAQSGFMRTELAPVIHEEEDPFGDSMSLRSQSTNMSNMTFGMGTPSASVRSFAIAQPTVASRVNVASLARSATLRSIGGASTAPPSAAAHFSEHPLDADDTASVDLYPPHRRGGSVQSFASNTDSVLASFPFVPPSPLPTSSSRSPLSVVFDSRNSHRQSGASSMFGSESVMTADDNAPPLPNTHDLAALNSNSNSARATAGSHSPLASSSFSTPHTSHQPTDSISRPRVSTSSSAGGLDDFDFEFSPAPDEPMPPLPHGMGMARLDSAGGALSIADKIDFDRASSRAPSMLVAGTGSGANANGPSNGSRASLDLLELSRDLAANRLAYDD